MRVASGAEGEHRGRESQLKATPAKVAVELCDKKLEHKSSVVPGKQFYIENTASNLDCSIAEAETENEDAQTDHVHKQITDPIGKGPGNGDDLCAQADEEELQGQEGSHQRGSKSIQ